MALALGVGSSLVAAVGIGVFQAADRLVLGLFAVALAGALGIALLSTLGKLRGSLSLEADELVLRYCFDIFSRRIALTSTRVRAGTLIGLRVRVAGGPISENEPVDEVRIGSYIELDDGRSRTYLGTLGVGPTAESWAVIPPAAASRRTRVDLTLAPKERAVIAYLLVDRGLLSVASS